MKETIFKDAFFRQTDTGFEIGNSSIKRTFALSGGTVRTVSLTGKDGSLFGKESPADCDFQFFGARPPAKELVWKIEKTESVCVPATLFDSAHLLARVFQTEHRSNTRIIREYRIYPEIPVISMQCRVTCSVYPNMFWNSRPLLRDRLRKHGQDIKKFDAVMDVTALPEDFSRMECVEFHASTDDCDNLVEKRYFADGQATGNLFFAAAPSGNGIFYLQEAPQSEASRELVPYDFRLENNCVLSCGWGIQPGEIELEREYISYRHVVGIYHSEAEEERVLKQYLKLRFESTPQRHAAVVNPWGCGKYIQLLNEEFMLREIESAAGCGAGFYQIDDSWQAGGNLGNICYYNENTSIAGFWKIRASLFGGSFKPIADTAKKNGIEAGLWIAPSSHKNYADYEEFIPIMLDFHRKYGINLIKIDGSLIRTYESEQRMRRILEAGVKESDGAVFFNLDTTYGQRPGYFLMAEYGNIFLENRYVCHNGGIGYHPERTLRNLWDLSRYMRTQKLQIEIPYPGDINYSFYRNKNESAPDTYPWEYWMAVAMFANPLFWFAPSLLTAEERARCKKFNELRNTLIPRISGGTVSPLGSRPGGRALTGFISENPQYGDTVILFREAECEDQEFQLPTNRNWGVAAGTGNIFGGKAVLPEKCSWLLLKTDK